MTRPNAPNIVALALAAVVAAVLGMDRLWRRIGGGS